MRIPKYFVLPLLLAVVVFASRQSSAVEARPLSLFPQQGYAKVFATLGVICECCDGRSDGSSEGACTSSWTGSCSRLKCLPWKQHAINS